MNEKFHLTHIHVGRDFHDAPGGRYVEDGPGNATDFRNKFLLPVLTSGGRAEIELDGVPGLPSSFLEEAFGGLVRLGYRADKIRETFSFIVKEPSFKRFPQLIYDHLDRAERLSTH
ncbi:STAS-like domain-containing protein [Pseudogemmobacter faecipullorum]|uniref:STAS-like domain-containing protein n=1 Tax=Pseudogemmobacter faecipullorum TaxID=2755041 RepID=A0ABS8CS09_9RHOB|nr:STAS-like domain-containing protein [Pseudogemmobacter faecipullorum]